jgi:hypothetical protein
MKNFNIQKMLVHDALDACANWAFMRDDGAGEATNAGSRRRRLDW